MTGVGYSINSGIGWCVSGSFGTDFVVNADEITLGIDKVIELGFSR